MSAPFVEVDDLHVGFGGVPVVAGVSFTIEPGEAVAFVGESGSGKSVTARSLVGLAGDGARVEARSLRLGGLDLLRFGRKDWRELRGRRVGFILQDALVSLDPIRPVGREIAETLRLHTALNRDERDRAVIELLGRVGVPEPELRARQLPSELSGGLRQRALIAAALAGDPELLIADEPTTALDVTVQRQILGLLQELKETGRSLLLISHDLAVVSSIADRVNVLRDGVIVEHGESGTVLSDPRDEYTRLLLAAVPAEHAKGSRLSLSAVEAPPRGAPGELVAVAEHLVKRYTGPDGVERTVVDDVSFSVRAGETLGIVGESGSGKTTTGRLVLGLEQPDAGDVQVLGSAWEGLSGRRRREQRARIQVIYQDPLSSFDPRHTVGAVIGEAVGVAGGVRSDRTARVVELLQLVGLGPDHAVRRPIELSGGQRQRVAIARALATEPELILLDEPVSALDVSIQAQVLDLLADVQARTGVAYLFISHDLGVIHHMSDRVLVLKDGRVVEEGDVERVFADPRHEYTRELIAAIPRLPNHRRESEATA